MEKIIKAKLLTRRDTSLNWVQNNPILYCGEIGYDSTKERHKIGDGVRHWTELPYFALDIDLNNKITFISKTTQDWDYWGRQQSQRNVLYIYSDYETIHDQMGNQINVPGIKLGDGVTYICNLPFITDYVFEQLPNQINNLIRNYFSNGKIEIDPNSFTATSKVGQDNSNLFTIQKDLGNGAVKKYIYTNTNGELIISGDSIQINNTPLIEYIQEKIDEIEISLPITVQIDSSAGNIFKNRQINTILKATVYKGGVDITSQIDNFHWTKKDQYGNIDPSWSRYTTSNILVISSNDMDSKAVFGCEVTVLQD